MQSNGLLVDITNIINLENKILSMARDLGHASELEIDISNPNAIFVKYFIPKSINLEMIASLKGIKEKNEEFSIGDFQTTKEDLVRK